MNTLALRALALALLLQAAAGYALLTNLTMMNFLQNTTADLDADYVSDTTRSVRLYIRKVDEQHPYFRCFQFEVPLELDYSLPAGRLLDDFKMKAAGHCNTTNVTRLVLNDFRLVNSDADVWRLKENSRIEIWSAASGYPTRAKTASAYARGALRRDIRKMRRAARKGMGGSSDEEEEDLDSSIEGDDDIDGGGIVVPDFDGDGEMDEQIWV